MTDYRGSRPRTHDTVDASLRRADAAMDSLRPGDTSPRGRAGVLLGRALWRALRPYASRQRDVAVATIAAAHEIASALYSAAESVEHLSRRLDGVERAVAGVQRAVNARDAWRVARIRRATATIEDAQILIPIGVPSAGAAPPGCVRVTTDEGQMWALAEDAVLTPCLVQEGTWEPEFTRLMTRYVTPAMTVLDVGANIGYVSRTLARLVGAGGMVIAVEPEPRNFEVLCANLGDLDGADVRCVRAAAMDRDGDVTLWLDDTNLGDHRTWAEERNRRRGLRVPAVRIDDLIDESIDVHVAKLDTQGTDHLAVAGMERTIARSRPVLFVEFWLDGIEGVGARAADVLDYYRSLDLEIRVADDPDRRFGGNDEIIDYTERNRGRYVDLVLQPR
jgi:FkbM family methyltransferase